MKVVNTFSFKDGEKFLKEKHPKEVKDVLSADARLNIEETA